MLLIAAIPLFSLLATVAAHPGEVEHFDTPTRREFLDNAKRSIANCQDELIARGIAAQAVQRRAALAAKLREELGLQKRSYTDVLNTSHKSNKTGLTSTSASTDIFTGTLSCVLQGEVTIGPYWVKGELIRKNVAETQSGVPLYTDYQVINVNTCQPIADVYLDTWHTNSTGVYAGIVANGNGNSADTKNINTTFARGIQKTDSAGVAYFQSIFPGHYTGRTTHIHVLATTGGSALSNNTFSGGKVSHIGQVFFDQTLISAVEATTPYSGNKQALTQNKADSIFQQEAAAMDPVFNYVYLGSKVTDGILGWITIGIDPTKSYTASYAASWTNKGGVANSGAGGH